MQEQNYQKERLLTLNIESAVNQKEAYEHQEARLSKQIHDLELELKYPDGSVPMAAGQKELDRLTFLRNKRLQQISSLGQDIYQAGILQKNESYAALPKNSDFLYYVNQGAALEKRDSNISNKIEQLEQEVVSYNNLNMTEDMWAAQAELERLRGLLERDTVAMSGTQRDIEQAKLSGGQLPVPEGNSVYAYMTEEEKARYYYLRGKEGKAGAHEYLDNLMEFLNSRKGIEMGEKVRGIDNGLGRTIATGAYGIGVGVDRFFRGGQQRFREERQPTSPMQYGSQYIREDLADVGPEILGNSFGQLLYDGTVATGNLLPSVLVSSVLGPAAGNIVMGLSESGDAYGQALSQGYSKKQANQYAALVGASETVLQYILGGVHKLSKGTTGKLAKIIGNIDNTLLRLSANDALDVLKEYGEERLQALLEPVYRNIIFGERNKIDPFSEDKIYQALLGALTAAQTNAVTNILDTLTPKDRPPDQQDMDRAFLQGFETAYGEDGTVQSKTDADRLSDTYNAYYFDRYKEVLKENAPQTLEEFSRIRYDNGEAWEQLQRQFEIVERYETRGTVPVDQVIELDQVAYRNKTDAFDYSDFHGDDRDFVKALAKSGNAAAMELDGKVYFSHSKVGTEGTLAFDAYGGEYPLIGLSEERLFTTQDLGDGIPREYDTEAKFLEYVAKVKKDTTEVFTVTILSEKHICESCEGVVEQFRKRYPNAMVNIVSGNPNYGEANAKGERGLKTWKHRKD